VAAACAYHASIRLAHEVEDQATADLLTKILKMEEGMLIGRSNSGRRSSRWAWRTTWPIRPRALQDS
jgi:hypothetical protein